MFWREISPVIGSALYHILFHVLLRTGFHAFGSHLVQVVGLLFIFMAVLIIHFVPSLMFAMTLALSNSRLSGVVSSELNIDFSWVPFWSSYQHSIKTEQEFSRNAVKELQQHAK